MVADKCLSIGADGIIPFLPYSASVQKVADFYRRWLTSRRIAHGREARCRLVSGHPEIFGRSTDLVLAGYDRWLERESLPDTVESFARFMSPRLRQWRVNLDRNLASVAVPSNPLNRR